MDNTKGPAVKAKFADREIWFLTGSQDLYGDETLRQVAQQVRRKRVHDPILP